MTNKENVIKEFESSLEIVSDDDNPKGSIAIRISAIRDAIKLLKDHDICENCAVAIEDRVLVVRCKDCRFAGPAISQYRELWCGKQDRHVDKDDFCSEGRMIGIE